MPKSVRWELYPVATESSEKFKYGGSYFEEPEFWTKPRTKNYMRAIWEMAKKYLTMWGYFRRVRSYWFALYPWHIGFYLIVLFHGLSLLGAILIKAAGLEIAAGAAHVGGLILYYTTIVVALSSFSLGTIGSIGLLIKRTVDEDLRDYASPQNYFNYVFCLAVFVSGLLTSASVYAAINSATGGVNGINNGTMIGGDGTGTARIEINSVQLALVKEAHDLAGTVLTANADVNPGQEIHQRLSCHVRASHRDQRAGNCALSIFPCPSSTVLSLRFPG